MENICPQCGGEVINKKGISKKTDKPYSFWGCSNFPECKYVQQAPKETPKMGQPQNSLAIIFDDLMARFTKLDEANKILNENIKLLHKKVDKLNGQGKTTDSPAE